jgi:hypothetical protein
VFGKTKTKKAATEKTKTTALFSIVRGWQLIEMTTYDSVREANDRVALELRDGFDQFPKGTTMFLTIYEGDEARATKEWVASGRPAA